MGPNAAFPINVSTAFVPADPFPQHITLYADGMVNIRIKMLITADVFAFTKAEIGEGDTVNSPRDVISVSVDRSSGILRFAKRNARWGDVWTGILHGQFGPNGQIQAIDGMDVHKIRFGYRTQQGNSNTPLERTNFNAEILTARGDNANGITYAWQQYRCPAAGTDSTDCYDASNGVFNTPVVTCVSRGAEGCLFEPYTFEAADVPYMTVYEHFNIAPSSYANPQQQALDDFFTSSEPLCFSTPARHLDPNVDCRRPAASLALGTANLANQSLALAATPRPKKVFFARTAENPASERRISDWASACGVKQGKVDLSYAVGPTGKTPANLVTSLASGTGHSVEFGIITGYGKFATDYAITATVEKNGEVLATKELTAPADGAQPDKVSVPFTLGGFTDADNLSVHFKGTFTCKKNPDITARNNIAYSMSSGPGALRVVYNAQ